MPRFIVVWISSDPLVRVSARHHRASSGRLAGFVYGAPRPVIRPPAIDLSLTGGAARADIMPDDVSVCDPPLRLRGAFLRGNAVRPAAFLAFLCDGFVRVRHFRFLL